MSTAEIYVTAAYLVFLTIVLAYVVIYSFKVRQLDEAVSSLTERPTGTPTATAEATEGDQPAVPT